MSIEESEIVAEATSPVGEAGTPELEGEALIDSELDALFSTEETPEEAPTTEAVKPVESETEASPDGLDESQLEEWSKGEAETPDIPAADSGYLADVAKVLPNREAAQFAIESFQKQTAMVRAMESGNIGAAMEAMPELKPLVQSVLQNYIAQNKEAIVQAWIEENDPEKANPEVRQLQARFKALDDERAAQQQQKANETHQQTMRQRTEAINTTIGDLFTKVKFTSETVDRGIVSDLFKVELSNSPDLMRKALSADPKDLETLLRKPFASAIRRLRDFEKTRTPAAQKETTKVIAQIGGVGSDVDQDDLDEAARYISSLGA